VYFITAEIYLILNTYVHVTCPNEEESSGTFIVNDGGPNTVSLVLSKFTAISLAVDQVSSCWLTVTEYN